MPQDDYERYRKRLEEQLQAPEPPFLPCGRLRVDASDRRNGRQLSAPDSTALSFGLQSFFPDSKVLLSGRYDSIPDAKQRLSEPEQVILDGEKRGSDSEKS